ncbi:hypothetical protein IFJ82_02860 [Novacetimonas hansenii]|uniref:hypothetical protein n=1 Tax=Novacetimonas hansenii TaxID=436 RepID=UPI00177CC060|nr:hypothetical protein [Novacetimonas hansenii]QOF95628.1 hypothetical protein IFJ82_02860 [Novacetimonas hansenii]
MIIRGYNFFCDMTPDMQYLRNHDPVDGFIERNMIFVLPDCLRRFRKNLYHVRRNTGPSHEYSPLFRVRSQLRSDPVPAGYDGPCDVFPFYANATMTRTRHKDYYVLFIFRDKMSRARFRQIAGA